MNEKKQKITNFFSGFNDIGELFFFLKKNLMLLMISLLVGAILGFFYNLLKPIRYEAIFDVSMAQIPSASNPGGLSELRAIETGSQLIQRMNSLKAYPPELVAACDLKNGAEYFNLNSISKMHLQKGSLDVVIIKVFGKSSSSALNCSGALFDYIKEYQNNQIADFINPAVKRLREATLLFDDYVNNAKKSSSKIAPSVYELHTLDEMRRLSSEISFEKKYIDVIDSHRTKLLSEVYVDPSPRPISLVTSIFFGSLICLVFGLAISFFRRALFRN